MKIVFDSEKQRDLFISLHCPGSIHPGPGVHELEQNCSPCSCKECWDQSGIILEVEGNGER